MKLTNDNHLRINGDELAKELGYQNGLKMREALARMRRMKPNFLKMEELDDLTEIEIEDSLTDEERALALLRQTKNPYYYRYGGMIVTISDKEKEVFRQSYLCSASRRENDAEHAWHAALMAVILEEYANEKVDLLKTITMLLIHDIVEIDAGDTYAYDV